LERGDFGTRTSTIVVGVFSTLEKLSLVHLLKACISLKVVLKDPIKDFRLSVGLRVERSTHASFNKGVGAYFGPEFGGDPGVSVGDYPSRRAELEFNILIE